MSDRLVEMAAEIERLRADLRDMTQIVLRLQKERMMREVEAEFAEPDARDDELRRLRARIAELEAANDALANAAIARDADAAITFGTLAQPTPDEPARYTHNIPPSAPPHDE